ncbi:hydratase [Bradyrhizobium sp. WYCCWR 13023]|uniref:Hydratase n=1 Tax=Bradyrhizobium zhengyangense TaxID=2911009 RepID=A0A9X1RHQ2_9BRAD|nr:fumarylacetoacetate hydrolase family protein [Bradyrhizobium zhengyangense]MCG2631388.1 hydratase [Bradyrhizobium zhengyangense]MCG2639352.1 hydratase [Bradyrhizobium zhengyangense]MCG2669443.1 hydratase [Bradyrhizobium zhengyangense]
MLDKDQIVAASRVLVQHWRDGSKFDALEAQLRPRSRADGYVVQAALENQSLGNLFGWKIAATSEAGQKHINVSGPLAGRIMSDTVIADGGTASMKGNAMRVGEPEFCFRMGRNLAPRSSPFGVDEVLAAVDTLHPAIEIPDSRFTDFTSAGEAQLIADNACAHLFVLGPATTANWRAIDLIEERPVITVRGERYIGHGKNVLGDPLMALTWLANELRELGITLRAGQVVTTGTCHPPLPIQAGDLFAADFGALGKVSVRFV